MPSTNLVRHCFKEPFGEGSRRNPSDLTPTARVLEAIIRRTLLPRLGYREGLTRLQLWLFNALMQQTVFDIWDLLLSEMKDTIAEEFRGVYTRIWKEDLRSLRAPKIMSARNRLRVDQKQLTRMQC